MTGSKKALDVFCSEPENFDLVITDMTMPQMTGMELSREFLSIRPDIPIILCTGFSEFISEDKIKETGICEFVMKPVLKSDIGRLIRRVLEKKQE